MNQADTERIQRELFTAGHCAADTLQDATAVVVNGCAVRDNADRKVWGMLGMLKGLKKNKPHLIVGLTGCTVHADASELAPHLQPVDVAFDTLNSEPLLSALARTAPADSDLYEDVEAYRDTAIGSPCRFVNVIYGCDKRCTYCIVPFRRGAQRSRPINEIVQEISQLRDTGAREVTLLGQIVNAYGEDMGAESFPDLLQAVDLIEGIERIRFTTAHPRYMTRQLAEAIRDIPSVCEEINLPVQAGHDVTLKRMARGYSVGFYRETIDMLRSVVPNIALTTDVIVGFCGETKDHFEASLRLIKELQFDQVHVAAFSKRHGTIAARWEDDVPAEEKMVRLHEIEKIQKDIAENINRRYIGLTTDVLLEELVPSKAEITESQWRGRTRTNKLVFLPNTEGLFPGKTLPIHIVSATPWSLRGNATVATMTSR
tara:strand:- start:13656 stop:14942 length:1287 start_codon:yes stop_codon:yes gene_type:complete